jgi:hypothetical protein
LKPETVFRIKKVNPFIKKLNATADFSIQQTSIIGDPDKLLCIRGNFVALELKDEGGGVLERLQEYNLSRVVAAGGYAYVADQSNWKEVSGYLQLLSNGHFVPCRENYKVWQENNKPKKRVSK